MRWKSLNLHDLSPAKGSNQDKERKGRGGASHRGEKCGRGTKGQKKRSQVPIFFEGGQTPLYRRIPKHGFNPINRTEYQEVNIRQLNYFDDAEEITPDDLFDAGIVDQTNRVKLLGDGELNVQSLTIRVHAASEGARKKIKDADGTVNELSETG